MKKTYWLVVLFCNQAFAQTAQKIQTAPTASDHASIGSVATYTILVAVLVTILLGGAFLVVNLGLMSKRRNDRTGHSDPSDVGGVLRSVQFPDEPDHERVLPAEDWDYKNPDARSEIKKAI